MCGESTAHAARFCSACGVNLDASIIVDPVADRAPLEADDDARGLSFLFVPLGVVVAIGLAVLFLVSGGDDEEPDAAGAEGVVEAPTATPLPPPTATPIRVTLPERTPIQPTPTRTPSAPIPAGVEPADVSALPPTDATHLAVAHDRDLAYLDLSSGEWIVHERVNRTSVPSVHSLTPYARGVVTSSGETVFYIPVDGRPLALGQGEALGVVDDLVYTRDWSTEGGPTIASFDVAGNQVGTLELPAQAWVVDVLPTGVFLIEAGGQVFTSAGDQSEAVATGTVSGVARDRFLLFSCPDGVDSCRYFLVDVAADTQVELQLPVGPNDAVRLAPDGRVLVWESLGESATAYAVDEDGVAVPDEKLALEQATLVELGLTGPAIATDTSGLYARIDSDRLLFHGPTGDAITEIALDFLRGFGDSYALAFVNADS